MTGPQYSYCRDILKVKFMIYFNDKVIYRNRTVAISNADPEQSSWIENLGFHEIAHS
jgi:hypothetical protein